MLELPERVFVILEIEFRGLSRLSNVWAYRDTPPCLTTESILNHLSHYIDGNK